MAVRDVSYQICRIPVVIFQNSKHQIEDCGVCLVLCLFLSANHGVLGSPWYFKVLNFVCHCN